MVVLPPTADFEPQVIDSGASEVAAKERMTAFLYAHYYAGFSPLASVTGQDVMVRLGARLDDVSFWEALCNANPGRGYRDSEWTAIRVEGQRVWARKAGLTLLLDRDRHLATGQVVNVGDRVAPLFPKGSSGVSPGFYVAYSNDGPVHSPWITRVYLNVKAAEAPPAMNWLLEALLRASIRYTFKIAASPVWFGRRDNTVLYLARSDFGRVHAILTTFCDRFTAALNHQTPGFTFTVAPGVAVADSPAGASSDESFGEHRCRILATALCRSTTPRTRDRLRTELIDEFLANGLDPAKPYLRGRDVEDYPRLSD
jgi:hypothetical protein